MTLSAEDQYAVAGARTDTGNLNMFFGLALLANAGLQSQVGAYLEEPGPGGVDPDALHTVWIGPGPDGRDCLDVRSRRLVRSPLRTAFHTKPVGGPPAHHGSEFFLPFQPLGLAGLLPSWGAWMADSPSQAARVVLWRALLRA